MVENQDEAPRLRGSGRPVFISLLVLFLTGALALWSYSGVYKLEPGQAALLFQMGKYKETELREGLHFHLPPPLQRREIILVDSIVREEFPGDEDVSSSAMQTKDNNIVILNFIVQYRISDAFSARYRLASRRQTLRDAAQAAVREVVGKTTIDEVLSDRRAEVELEASETLQRILNEYGAGLLVRSLQLQDVEPPEAVREAFDDVIAAAQDRDRKINEAEGYVNEVLPNARAQAVEIVQSAHAYSEEKLAQATGDASRFKALTEEYKSAPHVTRERLYLEAMEEVMEGSEIIVVEGGVNQVLPLKPLLEGVASDTGQ